MYIIITVILSEKKQQFMDILKILYTFVAKDVAKSVTALLR